MAETIRDLEIGGVKISMHDTYPISKPIPNDKALFRDLPQYVSNNAILEFLNDQPGIHVKSGIIFSRLRDSENKLTPYCSGDRFVYVRGNMSQDIHSTALIEHNKCCVLHKVQETACARCRKTDHATTNTNRCDAFKEDPDTIIIRSPSHVMCNYYKCNLKVFDMRFQSVEHAYQWRFIKYIGMDEHALEILDAQTPNEAKEISSRVPQCQHKHWHSIKLSVMKEILHAKADCSSLFRSTLINSMGKSIVESTQDLFLASGLLPRYSSSTKPVYFPGHNKLGHVLESVRRELVKEDMLTHLLSDTTNGQDVIYIPQVGSSVDDNDNIYSQN